jgi:hypothetical protein
MRRAGGNFASRLNFTGDGHNDTIEWQAEVAQLVEQLIRNQQVVGSSPTFGSILQQHKKIACSPEWPLQLERPF